MFGESPIQLLFYSIAAIILIVKIIERIREARKEDKDKYKDY